MKPLLLLIAALPFISCSQPIDKIAPTKRDSIKSSYSTVEEIPLPDGYTRVNAKANSFTAFLRKLKLKKDKIVYLYNGHLKQNQTAQFAVIDMPVGKEDLQQCADAVMRIRAEYLFRNKKLRSN